MVHATHLDDKWTWYVFLAVPSGSVEGAENDGPTAQARRRFLHVLFYTRKKRYLGSCTTAVVHHPTTTPSTATLGLLELLRRIQYHTPAPLDNVLSTKRRVRSQSHPQPCVYLHPPPPLTLTRPRPHPPPSVISGKVQRHWQQRLWPQRPGERLLPSREAPCDPAAATAAASPPPRCRCPQIMAGKRRHQGGGATANCGRGRWRWKRRGCGGGGGSDCPRGAGQWAPRSESSH